MSGSEVRRVSRQDIQLVQNLIERCLQLYMNQKEVVATLLDQAKIEPGFTELVWQKLEEENQEFFKAYHLRLIVKEQIIVFNKLLEKQVELMSQMCQTGVSSMSGSNGSHIPPIHPNSAFYTSGPTLKEEKVHHPISCTVSNAFTNGGFGVSAHSGRVNAVPDMLSMESSNMGSVQGLNGATIKMEAGYTGSSQFMFGSDSNVLEMRQTNVDGYPLNEPLMDVDASSFGFLGQIPRNFSLSDLTADYSQSSDILEYERSPFLDQADDKRLHAISEGFSYDDFGSD